MIKDNVDAKGQLQIVLRGADGIVKYEETVRNLVVTSGKNWIAARMYDTSIPSQMGYMAIGEGTTAASVGQTALVSEAARVAVTSVTVTNNEVQYFATFGTGVGTGAITEAGILNASTSGTMLARTVFSVVNKGADDTLSITWTVTIN